MEVALNQEPHKQELQHLKNGDESRFEIAVNSPKVKNAPVDDLKDVLRLVMLKVGVRANNLPTDEEKAVLLSHIISEYGNHTGKEILLAFDMAITGKLDLALNDVKCYENFTCLYFSQIMNAYREWASVAYRQIIKEDPIEQVIYTDEEMRNFKRSQTELAYQRLLSGNMNFIPKELMTEILTHDGLLKGQLDDFLVNALNSGVKNLYKKC